MTISIITSMYNRKPEVLEIITNLLLPSLLNNGRSSMELIIIDDCSPLKDATGTIIERYLPVLEDRFGNVIFVRNEANLGWTGSINKGIYMAGGKRLIIANDDVYFPSRSIERLAITLDRPEGYLIAGPITNASTAWSFQYCRQAPSLKSNSPAEIEKLEKFSLWLREKMRDRIITTNNLCGFCFAADSQLLKKIGGLEEKYKHGYFEDTDLIQRIAKEYGEEKIAINLEVFVGHGGVSGTSRTMLQEPFKMAKALIANGIKYASCWGYQKLLKRIVFGIRSQLTGKGTISELLPPGKINL